MNTFTHASPFNNQQHANDEKHVQKLINLANNVVAEFNGMLEPLNNEKSKLDLELKKLEKLEKKFKKSYLINASGVGNFLREFCIPFEYIPQQLYDLMHCIGWINGETHVPISFLKGFYSDTYYDNDERRCTKLWHYCTVRRYIDLLFINLTLENIYEKN